MLNFESLHICIVMVNVSSKIIIVGEWLHRVNISRISSAKSTVVVVGVG